MKDKKVLIGVVAAVIILLGAGSVMMFAGKSKTATTTEDTDSQEEQVQTLKPEEIGLTLTPRSDNKAVKFTISKASDIKTIEFDAVYQHRDNPGESIYDQIELDAKKASYDSKYYELGTCSSGVCRYHVGVKSVKFIFKITKEDNKVYQVEDTIAINQ